MKSQNTPSIKSLRTTKTLFFLGKTSGEIGVADKLDFEDTESYILKYGLSRVTPIPQTANITVNMIDVFEVETIIFNSVTYKTALSLDTDKIWLDKNLGATQVCNSSTDIACYGDLYQYFHSPARALVLTLEYSLH